MLGNKGKQLDSVQWSLNFGVCECCQVADYFETHVFQAPIAAQTRTDITESKRDKKKTEWRACADKYRSKKEHRIEDDQAGKPQLRSKQTWQDIISQCSFVLVFTYKYCFISVKTTGQWEKWKLGNTENLNNCGTVRSRAEERG